MGKEKVSQFYYHDNMENSLPNLSNIAYQNKVEKNEFFKIRHTIKSLLPKLSNYYYYYYKKEHYVERKEQ